MHSPISAGTLHVDTRHKDGHRERLLGLPDPSLAQVKEL